MIIKIDGGEQVRRMAWLCGCVAGLASLTSLAAAHADDAVYALKLAQGRFEPAALVVPADTALQLHVTNADAAAIEFESFELHRERVVQPGETITVYLPALKPGSYPFFDDFHRETPEGALVAK
jgi:heme/copper-type cytochrome/quinol oxidase subunit 2